MLELIASIDDVFNEIKVLFDAEASEERVTRAISLYAFNATGKTRLSSNFANDQSEPDSPFELLGVVEALVYGAHFEDIFMWDNAANEFRFDIYSSWILRLIADEGLDARIVDNFKRHTNSNVEPSFDFDEGMITFKVASGDEYSQENIKASRGEESLLVWSIFYTILELAVELLGEKEGDRAERIFDALKYVVIDDPVSSIDDTKIVSIATDVAFLTKQFSKLNVKVLILSHHALFHNVVVNSLRKLKDEHKSYLLNKTDEGFSLTRTGDTPFAYHLHARNLLSDAIAANGIERYHFNIFRALLEKTASFLGYNDWQDCVRVESRGEFERLLHLYSHGKLVELESRGLSSREKELFTETYRQFIEDYRWK